MITCIVLQLTRFFMTVIKYITLLLRFDFAVKFALRTEQSFNCATRGNLVVTADRHTNKPHTGHKHAHFFYIFTSRTAVTTE